MTVILAGVALGAKLRALLSLSAFLSILLAVFGFFCMGIFLSGIMLYTRDTYITQNTLFITMSLICGIAYPIQYLPRWVQCFAQIFPLTPAVTLFRNIVIGRQYMVDNIWLILHVFVLSGIYLAVGLLWNKSLERRMIESIFG